MAKPKHKRKNSAKILKVEPTPLILWHGFLRLTVRLFISLLVLAGLGGLGWGIKTAVDHLVFENPDYELRHIELNENEALNERGLIELTGLDLSANIYQIPIPELTRKLHVHPAVSSAEIHRRAPDTLVVTVHVREPLAWLACPEAGADYQRRPGGALLATDGVAYPCPELQFERAAGLPIVRLDAPGEAPVRFGEKVRHRSLGNCLRLLDAAARQGEGGSLEWIESVRQANDWSLLLTTRRGVEATFGLDDHARQLSYLTASLEHAATRGYAIATINLIPRRNVPVTLAAERIPKAVPVSEAEAAAR